MGKVKEALLEDMMFNPHLYNNPDPREESMMINDRDTSLVNNRKVTSGKETIYKKTYNRTSGKKLISRNSSNRDNKPEIDNKGIGNKNREYRRKS